MRATRILAGILIPLLFFLGWSLFFRPPVLGGGTAYIMVVGESMKPTMHQGDLAIVRKQRDYEHGDIVAFRTEGGIVIHRIVGGSAGSGFELLGDNKDVLDPWRPTPENIVGKYWFHIPFLGHGFSYLQQPLVLALFAGLIFFGTVSFGKGRMPIPSRRDARRKGKSPNRETTGGPFPHAPEANPWRSRMLKDRWLLGGFAAAIVFTGASGALFVFGGTAQPEAPASIERYDHRLNFAYEADTELSLLYPDGRIVVDANTPHQEPIFTQLVSRLHVDIDYAFEGHSDVDVEGVLTTRLDIEAPDAWTYSLPAPQESQFEEDAASERVTIDLGEVADIVATIEKETGYTARTYDLVVRAEIALTGSVGHQTVNDTHTGSFVFSFGKTLIETESPLVQSTSGPDSEQGASPSAQKASLVNLRGADPTRIGGAGGTLVGIGVMATLIALLIRQERTRPGKGIRSVNGERVLEVSGRSTSGGMQRIIVASLDDLAAVARREGEAVFHLRVDEGDIYFVPAGTVTYEFRVPNAAEPLLARSAQGRRS